MLSEKRSEEGQEDAEEQDGSEEEKNESLNSSRKLDNKYIGPDRSDTGSSDSDHSTQDAILQIRPKGKCFTSKKQLVKFLSKVNKEGFERILCSGNQYDPTSCDYIAELIG